MTSRRLLDPVSKALLDAADYIEKNGHIKHRMRGPGDSACVLGALVKVCNALPESLPPTALDSAERLMRHLGTIGIVSWNDAPERTQEEVVAALRGAAMMEDAAAKAT